MNYNRESLIEALEKLYGSYTKEQDRIKFGQYTLKDIGLEIGFDEPQMSRRINPSHSDKPLTAKSYQITMARVLVLIENKELEQENKKLVQKLEAAQQKEKDKPTREKGYKIVIQVLAFLLAGSLLFQYFNKPEPIEEKVFIQNKDANAGCLLSPKQLDGIITIIMELNQVNIALECVQFNLNIRGYEIEFIYHAPCIFDKLFIPFF